MNTDPATVKRIKESIVNEKDSIELVLNFKRDGSPFWNLLFIAPLYNSDAELEFYLGAQVDISPAVSDRANLLKVLSTSLDDRNIKRGTLKRTNTNPTKTSFFDFLHSHDKPVAQEPDIVADHHLLKKMYRMSLQEQMRTFSSIYSKVSISLITDCRFRC
jgi:hypothetical protein